MRKMTLGVLVVLLVVAFAPTTAYALPEVRCFQEFAQNMDDCSDLATWWQRSLCGADAEVQLAGCVGREIAPWR